MTKLNVVDRLKTNRAHLRKRVIRSVQSRIESCARGGHFPDFSHIVKDVMSTIANEMSEKPGLEIKEWIVMLQEKEPDRYCKNTMDIAEAKCEKE